MGKAVSSPVVWDSIDTYDYYTRGVFAVKNTVPTAEGALEIAHAGICEGTINGSNPRVRVWPHPGSVWPGCCTALVQKRSP